MHAMSVWLCVSMCACACEVCNAVGTDPVCHAITGRERGGGVRPVQIVEAVAAALIKKCCSNAGFEGGNQTSFWIQAVLH